MNIQPKIPVIIIDNSEETRAFSRSEINARDHSPQNRKLEDEPKNQQSKFKLLRRRYSNSNSGMDFKNSWNDDDDDETY